MEQQLVTDKADKTAFHAKVDKGSLVINVKDYGAEGDGTTDDSTAFLAAINASDAADAALRARLWGQVVLGAGAVSLIVVVVQLLMQTA